MGKGGEQKEGGMRRNDSATDMSDADLDDKASAAARYKVKRSKLINMVNWIHVTTTFAPHAVFAIAVFLVIQFIYDIFTVGLDTVEATVTKVYASQPSQIIDLGWRGTGLFLIVFWYLVRRQRHVYLIDFATWEPPASWKLTHTQLLECMRRQNCFTADSIGFMERLLENSGTGDATAWPPGIVRSLEADAPLADRSVEAARAESERIVCDVAKTVLERNKVKPVDVDVLIINCSLFSPTPSLCALVAHKFGMRPDVRSYNLSGMGCSAGLISVQLAQDVLAATPNCTALVISTENLTQNLYHGNERAMLLQNVLFRCGGAALLLSNKWMDGRRAQFKLLHCIRVQGVGEEAYECVYEKEDAAGFHGVALARNIVTVAGKTMEKNFTVLGPYVLPITEQLKVGYSIVKKMGCKYLRKTFGDKSAIGNCVPEYVKPYVPDFKRGIDHFCIHAGGRAVIDGIVKNLNLLDRHEAPSRHALYTYGNTSSSSIWYEMDYVRSVGGVRRGHRVLQVAFGSGFKCNSAVWLALNHGSSMPCSESAVAYAAENNKDKNQ